MNSGQLQFPESVWIVTSWDAHTETIEGVFTTEELSKSYMEAMELPDGAVGWSLQKHQVRSQPIIVSLVTE